MVLVLKEDKSLPGRKGDGGGAISISELMKTRNHMRYGVFR